jgi:hypothetical protein
MAGTEVNRWYALQANHMRVEYGFGSLADAEHYRDLHNEGRDGGAFSIEPVTDQETIADLDELRLDGISLSDALDEVHGI